MAVHKLPVLPGAQNGLDWPVCCVFGSPTISPVEAIGFRGESGPLHQHEFCWHFSIALARLTRGLRTTRIDTLGLVSSG